MFDFHSKQSKSSSSTDDDFFGSSSEGFQDMPKKQDDPFRNDPSPSSDFPGTDVWDPAPRRGSRKPRRAKRSLGDLQIPWRIVLPVLAIAAVIVLCIVFHEQIFSFLTELIVCLLIILVIIWLIKRIIFPPRNRW